MKRRNPIFGIYLRISTANKSKWFYFYLIVLLFAQYDICCRCCCMQYWAEKDINSNPISIGLDIIDTNKFNIMKDIEREVFPLSPYRRATMSYILTLWFNVKHHDKRNIAQKTDKNRHTKTKMKRKNVGLQRIIMQFNFSSLFSFLFFCKIFVQLTFLLQFSVYQDVILCNELQNYAIKLKLIDCVNVVMNV